MERIWPDFGRAICIFRRNLLSLRAILKQRRAMEEVVVNPRIMDPGRGPFCDTDKQGNAVSLPPTTRDPVQDRETNPRAVRHLHKTAQDHSPVDKRPRKQLADRRRDWITNNRPTRSADYARMPRA